MTTGQIPISRSNKPESCGTRIVIAGAGGHGRVLLDIFRNNHQFDVVAFLDADTSLHGKEIDGLKIIDMQELLSRFESSDINGAIVAIGDNHIRQEYANRFAQHQIPLVSAIHPSASVAATATIGKNVAVAAAAIVCTHVKIEDSVIINTGAIVDHESHIQQAAHICPGVRIAGRVAVHPYAFIGIGATIIQGISVGEAAVVGAGAVVLDDVPPFTTVVGVPAKATRAPQARPKSQAAGQILEIMPKKQSRTKMPKA